MNRLALLHLHGLIEPLSRLEEQRSLPYCGWLAQNFADVACYPLAERHRRLWDWFVGLTPGVTPTPRVEVWPRGGAKSATAELGVAYLAGRLTRRFVLYVCATQSQADLHVQAIAAHLEQLGIERAVSKYGFTRGWRRNQLQTLDGFHVAAYGLDGASRGIKIGRFRPDLIIFDDIDSQADGHKAIYKKIEAITTAILPAGPTDCAVLFNQNLIHEEGVVAQLVDGRALFLLGREVPTPDPAVRGLVTEIVQNGVGANVYAIKAGEATWEGQSLATCERQINDWGLRAFLREAQHEVAGATGWFFDTSKFEIVDEIPAFEKVCIAFDLAATEGGGDYTAAVLMGKAFNGQIYVLKVICVQHSSEKVRELVRCYAGYTRHHFPDRYTIRLPQDPAQAGKAQADQFRRMLAGFNLRIVTIPRTGKAGRATGYAEQVNLGNVKLLRGDWNAGYVEEHRKFREDMSHEHDNQVDAAADAFNELFTPTEGQVSTRMTPNPAYAYQRVRSRSSMDQEEE